MAEMAVCEAKSALKMGLIHAEIMGGLPLVNMYFEKL